MNRKFEIKSIVLAVAAAQLGLIQVPQAGAQPMLERVLVTARKKTETLMEAPLSVTAVSGQNMDNMGITNLVGNAAEMTSQGVEVDGQFAVTENLELGGAIAYLDNEYEDFPRASCTIYQAAATPSGEICTQNLKGESGAFAPEWSSNLYAQFEYPLGDNLLLNLRGDASYKDDYYTSADNDPNSLQDSFWKYNARISLSDQGGTWEVAAYGRNLTDEATTSFTIPAPLGAGIYGNGREEPRVYGMQARYNF